MNIVTHYDPKPIPTDRFDWSAVDDSTYDGAPDSGNRSKVGYGATRGAAIADLLVTLGVELLDVESSNVGRIGYENHLERLWVQFRDPGTDTRDGTVYAYEAVPQRVYDGLVAVSERGESVGTALNALVKRGGYEYGRVE